MIVTYAGIGSRETPAPIMEIMKKMASHLAQLGVVLRSGAAEGADAAFEFGCDLVNGPKEIYLPWKGFQNSKSELVFWDTRAYEFVDKYHPNPTALSQGAKKLQARNTHQILGWDLGNYKPSDFVICYTPKGKGGGGTGQALRLAKDFNIPIFDCGKHEDDLELLKKEYKIFLRDIFETLRGKET